MANSAAVPPSLASRASANSKNGAQAAGNDFKEAPEWVKLLVIFLTSGVVAFFEYAICKSAFRMPLSNWLDLAHTAAITARVAAVAAH